MLDDQDDDPGVFSWNRTASPNNHGVMVLGVYPQPTFDAMALEYTPVHNIGGDTASRCVLSARLVELDLCGEDTLGTRKYQTIYSDSRVPARHQTAILPHLFVTTCFFAGKLTPCLQLTWPGAGRGNTP